MQDIPRELIEKAALGDMEAFEVIYRVTSGFVYNVALRVTGGRESAQDVTQEVFIKVYKGLKGFRFGSSFKTWIYRITVNLAINAYNKGKRHESRTVEYDDAIENVPAAERTEGEIDRTDNEELIKQVLGSLNPDQRACVVLRNMEGLSYEEIAKTLRVNINTVRTRLKRARERILSRFGKRRKA